ncbi:hypothetical protein NDU88_005058 [Pleurodeles waltl]|uniref:Uncharacterized protein n=1 Tax=Pleurodeles waltl TaxID=8319 RepID=A0AAV7V2Z0_PLEWA|nr:hypothetical protein NDU88_005058 [Pleurodeles waltl]
MCSKSTPIAQQRGEAAFWRAKYSFTRSGGSQQGVVEEELPRRQPQLLTPSERKQLAIFIEIAQRAQFHFMSRAQLRARRNPGTPWRAQ